MRNDNDLILIKIRILNQNPVSLGSKQRTMKKKLTWKDFEPIAVVSRLEIKEGEIYADTENINQETTFGLVEKIDNYIHFKHIAGKKSYTIKENGCFRFGRLYFNDTWLHVKLKTT